jgi:ATP-dependent helicase HrpB
VRSAELFLCLDVDGAKGEAVVRKASAVERDWLPAEELTTGVDVFFEPEAGRGSAPRRVRFGDLVLEESPAAIPEGETTAAVLAEAAVARWDRFFPPDDPAVEQFLARLRSLREWMPELGMPSLGDDDLKSLLPLVCFGRRSLAELRKANWIDVLRTRFAPQQWAALEREAPERITVPTGSRIALTYEAGRPPVLPVRIQELFGMSDTPRVAGGRVRVLLHLLAPNMRPQQITDDLASFWANGYLMVRKELRARYPKHDWPDDPAHATPQRGPKRRK